MELFEGSKLIHHLDRVVEWQQTGIARPILLEIDMTNICDHKCPLCTYGFARNSSQLDLTDVQFLLSQAEELGVLAVVFTGGGEPLINKSTLGAIKWASQMNLEVGLITHGGWITQDTAASIVEYCTWCRISLDATNPALYEQTHGVGIKSWGKTIAGIKNLVQARAVSKSEITIGIGYLVDERTAVDALAATDLSVELGVDYIQYRPFRETTYDIRPHMEEIRKHSKNGSLRILHSEARYDSLSHPRNYTVCNAPNFSVVVGADFKVYVCCDTKYKKESLLGDLRTQTLAEIWHSEFRRFKDGKIYSFCPQPCRHNANNLFLSDVKSNTIHKNFI